MMKARRETAVIIITNTTIELLNNIMYLNLCKDINFIKILNILKRNNNNSNIRYNSSEKTYLV